MILAVDIGGTKVDIALFSQELDSIKLIYQEQYQSKQYLHLTDLLKEFQKEYNFKASKVCLAIAGPVIDNTCTTTNLPWNISKKELEEFFNTKKIALINDLEATAYGMLYLNEDQFVSLNPKGIKKDANCAVIAAGTGLGQAQLFFNQGNYFTIGSEGGHCDFAPQNLLEDKLLIWLRKKFPKHVSYERILCGSGILLIYTFLCEENNKQLHKEIKNSQSKNQKSSLITKLALEKNDQIALQSLELFCNIYGAEAGNLALKSLSLGGVYIGGGIAPEILPVLEKYFMRAFLSKGRFESLLESIEVKVSLNKKTALLGAAYFARDKL